MNPNALAWLAMGLWPVVSLSVFAVQRNTVRVARTTAWMVILPALFLPERIQLKAAGIPGLDKYRLAILCVAVALALFHPRQLAETLRAHAFPRVVLAFLAFGAIQTVATNGDALSYGPTLLPALDLHDARSIVMAFALDFYLPFALGQRVFRDERALRDLFEVMTLAAFLYLPLALVELRLSPQLHRWVYGFHQHEFAQMVRGEGYRPMVFTPHPLCLAQFVLVSYQAATALQILHLPPLRPTAKARTWITGLFLLACKSLGAILQGAATTPVQRLSGKWKGRVAAGLAVVVLAYPVIRAERLLPLDEIVGFFAQYSEDRAQSLGYRFNMEEQLLARARDRPVYGWGSWGRNQVYAPWGQVMTVVDGQWVGLLGSFGYVGFAGFFGLLLLPVFAYMARRRALAPLERELGGTLALIVAVTAVDLLPNSAWGSMPLVYAGALLAVSSAVPRRGARAARGEGRQHTGAVGAANAPAGGRT